MANIFELPPKGGNISPEKAHKSRQMHFRDKSGVFAINKILRYRGSHFPASHTLCHPGGRDDDGVGEDYVGGEVDGGGDDDGGGEDDGGGAAQRSKTFYW